MTHNQSSDDPAPSLPKPSIDGSQPATGVNAGQAGPVPEELPRELPPAAQRALAEADARRRAQDAQNEAVKSPAEHGGREGPDPVRYGDWEKGGIVSDF